MWYPAGTCQSMNKIQGYVWYKLSALFFKVLFKLYEDHLMAQYIFFPKQSKPPLEILQL